MEWNVWTLQYLDNIKSTILDNLKMLTAAPSVQMQDVPSDLLCLETTEETDPDVRNSTDDLDKRSVLM